MRSSASKAQPNSQEKGRQRHRSREPSEDAGEVATGPVRLRDLLAEPRVAPVRGTRAVSATLPNGRTAWLRIEPSPVSATELEHLRRAIKRRSVLRAEAQQENAVAVRELAQRFRVATKRIVRRQLRSDRRLEAKVSSGDQTNERRFEREFGRLRSETRKQELASYRAVRRLERRQLWDAIMLASSVSLFSAYGQRANPFAEHNLTLMISTLAWLLGDEITDFLAEKPRPRDEIVRDRDLWSYIAPFGNLLTAWWLLDDRQHQRFVSGIADRFIEQPLSRRNRPARRSFQTSFDLAPLLGSEHIDDFRTFANVPVVVTILGGWVDQLRAAGADAIGVSATVELGVLTIRVTVSSSERLLPVTPLPLPTAAWLVDVHDPLR